MENLLNNAERLALIESYKADKLNAPPPNIKDKTLITNYGTDEQKARLLQAPAAETQKATENKAAEQTPTTGDGAGEPSTGAVDTEQAQNAANSNDGEPITGDGTGQALPEILPQPATKEHSYTTGLDYEKVKPALDENQEYVKEFNRYVDLFVKMPKDNLTAAELKTLNDGKEISNAQDARDAQTIKANVNSLQSQDAETGLHLRNVNDVNNVIIVSQLTYDKFLKKDKEWELMPKTPPELL